jgi:TolB-like protein
MFPENQEKQVAMRSAPEEVAVLSIKKQESLSGQNLIVHSSEQDIWDYVEKIITSKAFSGSEFLKRLLKMLITKVLRAEEDDINEYSLAVEVFGRENFDPRIDTIVRVQARRLRLKLQKYYSSEGQYDAARIDIPKGSYVPVISHVPGPVNGDRCRIAVLPFLDLSNPDTADPTFADAVTETLISALTVAGNFDVIGRTSVFTFKESFRDVRNIGKRLNVDVILEGSIQRSATLLRVNARLADVSTGFILWTNTFDIKAQDRIAAQEQIASAIVPSIRDRFSSLRAKSA